MLGVILLFGLFIIELIKLIMRIHAKYRHMMLQQQAALRKMQRPNRPARRRMQQPNERLVTRVATNTRQ